MKISDASQAVQNKEAQGLGSGQLDPAGRSERGSASDRVSLARGAVLEEASRIAREQRLARLKQVEAAVSGGSYRPDPAQIAERIVEDAEVSARIRASLLG